MRTTLRNFKLFVRICAPTPVTVPLNESCRVTGDGGSLPVGIESLQGDDLDQTGPHGDRITFTHIRLKCMLLDRGRSEPTETAHKKPQHEPVCHLILRQMNEKCLSLFMSNPTLAVRTHQWIFSHNMVFSLICFPPFTRVTLLLPRINRSEEEYTQLFSSING